LTDRCRTTVAGVFAAPAGDAAALTALNATVPTTTALWIDELEPVATRQSWLEKQHALGNPVLVAEAMTQ
jgi:L-amino acid N-acyltransferase YncA